MESAENANCICIILRKSRGADSNSKFIGGQESQNGQSKEENTVNIIHNKMHYLNRSEIWCVWCVWQYPPCITPLATLHEWINHLLNLILISQSLIIRAKIHLSPNVQLMHRKHCCTDILSLKKCWMSCEVECVTTYLKSRSAAKHPGQTQKDKRSGKNILLYRGSCFLVCDHRKHFPDKFTAPYS